MEEKLNLSFNLVVGSFIFHKESAVHKETQLESMSITDSSVSGRDIRGLRKAS